MVSASTNYRGKNEVLRSCVVGLYPHIRPLLPVALANTPHDRRLPRRFSRKTHGRHLTWGKPTPWWIRGAVTSCDNEAAVPHVSRTPACVQGPHSIEPIVLKDLRYAWKFPSHFQTPTRVVTYCEKAAAVVELQGRHLVREAVVPYTSCGAVTS